MQDEKKRGIEHRAWSIGKYSWQVAAGRKKSAAFASWLRRAKEVGDQMAEER